MEITEPNFLGKIRFGAGKNCACQPVGVGGIDGQSRITYQKRQHSFTVFPTGCAYTPNSAFRSLTTSGSFFGPYTTPEGTSVGSMLGTWVFDRRTGLCNRARWFLRGSENLVGSTPTSGEFFYDGNPDANPFDVDRSGTVRLGVPYTIKELNDDVQALMDSAATSIWLVPPEKSLLVGVEEIGSVGDPWINQNYFNRGPCTGNIAVREESASPVFQQNVGVLITHFRWADLMFRQRCLVPIEGYFSTQLTTQWDLGIGPGQAPRIVEPKRYWYTKPGRVQFDSVAITPSEADQPFAIVDKYLTITLNDMPPSGQEAKDWPTTAIPGYC